MPTVEEDKKEEITEVSQLFGMKQLHTNTCLKCGFEIRKESVLLACNLNYPTSEPERDEWPFCEILTRSLCPQQCTPAWCDKCMKFGPTSQAKTVQSLPKVLSINTGLNHPQNKLFWQSQMDKVVAKVVNSPNDTARAVTPNSLLLTKPCRYGDNCSRPGCRFRHSIVTSVPLAPSNNPYCSNNWLPHQINMTLTSKRLNITKVEAEETSAMTPTEKAPSQTVKGKNGVDTTNEKVLESRLFNLTAVVCYINDTSVPEKRNLVSLIKVPDSHLNSGSGDGTEAKWYLFNDLCISPVASHEAVWFSLDWKLPCVLYYSSQDILCNKTEITTAITKVFIIM